jgi:hypothetical protein
MVFTMHLHWLAANKIRVEQFITQLSIKGEINKKWWMLICSVTYISTCFGHLYAHCQESKLCFTAYGFQHWLLLVVVLESRVLSCVNCGGDVPRHSRVVKTVCSKAQSTLLTMGIKTPETCWDITDWINWHSSRLVGLTFNLLIQDAWSNKHKTQFVHIC